jgi:hypothetical protein
MKTTGPTTLTSLAQPMILNDASGKVPRHEWSCDREAAVWTIFVAAVCRRIIVLGSRRGFDTMLPPIEAGLVRFHFSSVLFWRCQDLELENGGPRVLCCPFDAWDARRAARGHAPDAGCLRHPHPNATLFAVLLCLPTAPGLPLQRNGDFGTSAFFGQLSDKPLLACI